MKDPVCGMEIGENAKFVSNYKGKRYCFCSKSCKEIFDKSPDKYLK